jgi:uncharacterized protein YoaH (UPF0181 family)
VAQFITQAAAVVVQETTQKLMAQAVQAAVVVVHQQTAYLTTLTELQTQAAVVAVKKVLAQTATAGRALLL